MSGDLNFSPEEFEKLTLNERIALCRKMAQRAQAHAENAQEPHRVHYLEIAREWLKLAEEIERLSSH